MNNEYVVVKIEELSKIQSIVKGDGDRRMLCRCHNKRWCISSLFLAISRLGACDTQR